MGVGVAVAFLTGLGVGVGVGSASSVSVVSGVVSGLGFAAASSPVSVVSASPALVVSLVCAAPFVGSSVES